jgi:hypothetical protein
MFRGRSVVGRSDWQADSHGRTRLSTKHFFRTSSEHRTAAGHNTYVNFTHVGGSKLQSRAMGGIFSMGTGGVAGKAARSEFQPSISRVCGRLTNPEHRRPGLRCVDSFLLFLLHVPTGSSWFVIIIIRRRRRRPCDGECLLAPGLVPEASLEFAYSVT